MEKYKVVLGIKLYERKCKMCTVCFFVAQSHPQAYCSEMCADDDKGQRKAFGKDRQKKGKKNRKLKYVLKRSDYEKS